MRPKYTWRLRTRALELGPRTLVMGVLNVTPDSFSDAGQFFSPERAVAHALAMLDEGADILDIGGESTRPGVPVAEGGVSTKEELRRVLPVLDAVRNQRPDAIVSIDTYKAEVARAAVEAGAEIVNDVSALRWDKEMPRTCAELGCGVVLMHTRGRPEEWRTLKPVDDIVWVVTRELRQWTEIARGAGIEREKIVVDPGFGFGKNFEENYPLLARFWELQRLGYPLLAGTSRKSFIGRTLAREGKDVAAEERLYGTLATVVAAALKGAHIVRVHDVAPAVDAVKIADAVIAAEIG